MSIKAILLILIIILNISLPYLYYSYLRRKKRFYVDLVNNFIECVGVSIQICIIVLPILYIFLGMFLGLFVEVREITFLVRLGHWAYYWAWHIIFLITLGFQLEAVNFKYKKAF